MALISSNASFESRLPHRLAVALVCATFPLIWVGGLVTTYDAGMAVPDWPTTYGYNLLLYPWQTWIYGPWDLFIEHGHRLLAALVGLLTIAFVVAVWVCDRRRWMLWLALGALAGVIGQGVLGGMRVRLDEIVLARIHGCVGPAFFAYIVALAVLTSGLWLSADAPRAVERGGQLRRLAFITTALAYLQLVLGSALRHMPVWATPGEFRTALVFHLFVALALGVHIILLLLRVLQVAGRQPTEPARLRPALVRPAALLTLMLFAQLGLGLGTWMAKYGWPTWLGAQDMNFVVEAEGRLQAQVTTAHVALGSLILATALLIALRCVRLVRGGGSVAGLPAERPMELAL
jgi:heme a synthase